MHGQTGSGKTYTMEAVHACLAEQVFGGGGGGGAAHQAAGCLFPAAAAAGVLEVEVLAVEVLGRRCEIHPNPYPNFNLNPNPNS